MSMFLLIVGATLMIYSISDLTRLAVATISLDEHDRQAFDFGLDVIFAVVGFIMLTIWFHN